MMKPQHIIFAGLFAAGVCVLAAQNIGALPDAWVVAGESPKDYAGGVDFDHSISGKGAKFLRNASGNGKSWGSLVQVISAQRYAGKRLQFKALVRTTGVSDWAGLWMAVDTPTKNNAAFYNSSDKPIKGNTDWSWHGVVLDVPADASAIRFGVINAGSGEVWIDDLHFDVVGPAMAVDIQPRTALPEAPEL